VVSFILTFPNQILFEFLCSFIGVIRPTHFILLDFLIEFGYLQLYNSKFCVTSHKENDVLGGHTDRERSLTVTHTRLKMIMIKRVINSPVTFSDRPVAVEVNQSRLVFVRYSVQISAGTAAFMTEISRGSPQDLKKYVDIIPRVGHDLFLQILSKSSFVNRLHIPLRF
jgi:hypothetical protein